MPSPPEERSPRKNGTPPKVPLAPLATVATPSLPPAGGHTASTTKFTPKYVPRLIGYQAPEYQDENWRE